MEYIRPAGGFRQRVFDLVEQKVFQNIVMAAIVINSIGIGLETSPEVYTKIGIALVIIDYICLGIFVIELILKLIGYGGQFFKSGVNIFDAIIIIMSILPNLEFFSVFRVFRIFRVFRATRLISGIGKLRMIMAAIQKSIPSIMWTGLLLLIVYYIFAVIGTVLFGGAFPEWFGNIAESMYTLFQVMTLESWSMGISRPVMEVYPAAWLYFVPFVLISAFVMMNVVVGIVVSTISEATDGEKREKATEGEVHKGDALRAELANLRAQLDKVELLMGDYESITKDCGEKEKEDKK